MVTLETVKSYLNLDQDFKDDDALIITIINSVENAVMAMTNGPDTDDGFNDNPDGLPSRFDLTVLMLVAEFYARREVNISGSLKESPTFKYIIGSMTKYNQF